MTDAPRDEPIPESLPESFFSGAPAPGPRVGDHALSVYAAALHPEALEAARERRLEGPGWSARAAVLRPFGHLIELRRERDGAPPEAVTEVACPAALALPQRGRVAHHPLALRAVLSLPGGLYAASFACQVEPDPEAYARLLRQILATPCRQGERMFLLRGHPENDGPRPFTLLDVDDTAGHLEAFVVHAFPADLAVVFHQASFGG